MAAKAYRQRMLFVPRWCSAAPSGSRGPSAWTVAENLAVRQRGINEQSPRISVPQWAEIDGYLVASL